MLNSKPPKASKPICYPRRRRFDGSVMQCCPLRFSFWSSFTLWNSISWFSLNLLFSLSQPNPTVSVSVFRPFSIFVDVRRLSSIFAMLYCLSQMFVDFRKYVFLHFCISALRHFWVSVYGSVRIRGCQTIGIRRGRLHGQGSQNEIISDLSLAMFLARVVSFTFFPRPDRATVGDS